ncbi:hypothetical protein [Streptomyces ardesiacus]|uniref:hypothetical protein n=1 Tax=Streptomyces ardesiacus TaxID=285564 RepID=UPI0036EFF576
MGRDKARKPRRAKTPRPVPTRQDAQDRYRSAMETWAAAEAQRVRAGEAVTDTKATITVLQAEKTVAQAAADATVRRLEAVRRLRVALPDLRVLWSRFPGLLPEDKFTAAGLTLADFGLVDGDLEVLAAIPRGAAP